MREKERREAEEPLRERRKAAEGGREGGRDGGRAGSAGEPGIEGERGGAPGVEEEGVWVGVGEVRERVASWGRELGCEEAAVTVLEEDEED